MVDDNLDDFLKKLLGATPGVKSAAIVSAEGLPIVSALPQGVDETKIAGMTGALLSLSERAIIEMGRGDFDQLYIKGSKGYLLVMQVGPKAVLLVSTTKNAKIGFLEKNVLEFLNTLKPESMEGTDPLLDIHYPRNIESDKLLEQENLAKEANLLIDKLITNIQRKPSKKRVHLRLFLEKFRDLTDNDKNTIIQSLKKNLIFPTWYYYLRLFLEKFRDSSDNEKNTIIQSLKYEETKEKSDYGDDDDDGFPFSYIFKPPEPPDDFVMAPQVQLRAPLKEKDPEEEIYCQYCGMKLTKEEQSTHSCKKKPEQKLL